MDENGKPHDYLARICSEFSVENRGRVAKSDLSQAKAEKVYGGVRCSFVLSRAAINRMDDAAKDALKMLLAENEETLD